MRECTIYNLNNLCIVGNLSVMGELVSWLVPPFGLTVGSVAAAQGHYYALHITQLLCVVGVYKVKSYL